jgi:hypothetical protein
VDELVELYRNFLLAQLDVVSGRYGRENARQSFERTLRSLAPELQEVAKRYHLDKVLVDQYCQPRAEGSGRCSKRPDRSFQLQTKGSVHSAKRNRP